MNKKNWNVVNGASCFHIRDEDGRYVAKCPDDKDGELDAYLISATPALRETCERCLPDWWQEAIDDTRKGDGEICCEITYGDVRALVEALKKAEVK